MTTETLGVPTPTSEVQLVDTGFSLDNDVDSVEILLLQWHTPDPADSHGIWQSAQPNEIMEKRAILEAVATRASVHRIWPLFVIAPELSLPLELVADVEKVVASAAKPVVFVT